MKVFETSTESNDKQEQVVEIIEDNVMVMSISHWKMLKHKIIEVI